MNNEKRKEWKIKFDEWWTEQCSKGIKKTKSNPNGVAISCNLYPSDVYDPDAKRRYVEVVE